MAADKKAMSRTKGATDELEAMRIAVTGNVGLFNRVMDKIRQFRMQSQKTIFDTVKEKQALGNQAGKGR